MSKITHTKTNFTAGEISRDLLGRGDLTAYQNGALTLRNVTIAPTGGASRRPGLRHVDMLPGPGRLVAFEFNTEQTYLMVFTDQWLDVYSGDERVAGFAAPWTEAQLPQIGWTQSADTLLVVHPDVAPRKITRTGAASWTVAPWTFFETDGVIQQPYHKFAADGVTLTPSGTSGVVTLTASAAVFQSGHVGTRFRIGGKEVEITAIASPTQATASCKQGLSGTAATKDWEEQALSPVRGWPVSCCFHQDRLVIGGARDVPNRLWLSKSADLFNFDLGTGLDDEAIEFGLLSDQVNAIRAVVSSRHLLVFTSGAEWMVSGEPLTPTKIQLTRQTRMGSPVDRSVPPRDVDGAVVFVSRDGGRLCEFLFSDTEQAYQATDLAMLSGHLMNRPVDQDYDPSRRLFHMVMGDGSLATLTLYRAERVTAWTGQRTAGEFTAVAVVDETVYLLVRRDGTVMLERFDRDLALDSALDGEQDPPAARWTGLDHLEGWTVRVLADDGAVAEAVVSGGAIELDEPAARIQVGLPFTLEIEPLPPQGNGVSMSGAVRLVRAGFRLLDTRALAIDTGRGAMPIPFRRYGRDRFDAAPPLFSGDVTIRAIGWKRDAFKPLWAIRQDMPMPCTVLAVSTEMKVSD